MITLKTRDELEKMRKAGKIVGEVISTLGSRLAPGVNTMELERIAVELIAKRGAKPAFPMVPGYKHALCVSVNEAVVHGIPSVDFVINEGDIVSIDCGIYLDGFYGDHAWTFPVGEVGEDAMNLLKNGEECLALGIEKCTVENRLYDISYAIQTHAESNGYSVVVDYVGHGIGSSLHEDPQVPNFGAPGTGPRLREGMVLALEPMVNIGTYEVETLKDGWTVVTKDSKLSVHFEHMVAITANGPDVLSKV